MPLVDFYTQTVVQQLQHWLTFPIHTTNQYPFYQSLLIDKQRLRYWTNMVVIGDFAKTVGIVSVVDNKGTEQAIEVRPPNETTDLPMVVLVDSFSASGSEVLAGALQDYDRAIVAGNTTYGKGSVNALHQLTDGSALYITTARWLTPDGRPIEGKGIEPDIPLELEGDNAIQWAIDYLKNEE